MVICNLLSQKCCDSEKVGLSLVVGGGLLPPSTTTDGIESPQIGSITAGGALQTRSCPIAAITGDVLLATSGTLNIKTHFLFTWRSQPLSVGNDQLWTLSPLSAKWGTLKPPWGLLSSVNLNPSCCRHGGILWSTLTTLRNRHSGA